MRDPSRTSRRALLAGAAIVLAGSARAQPSDDPAQLLALMERYAAGLRWGAADALVALYTPDGVFIRDDLPAATGTEALRAAYRQVFATLKVDLAFEIKETEVAGDMAWLRATSKGRVRTVASGAISVCPYRFHRRMCGSRAASSRSTSTGMMDAP